MVGNLFVTLSNLITHFHFGYELTSIRTSMRSELESHLANHVASCPKLNSLVRSVEGEKQEDLKGKEVSHSGQISHERLTSCVRPLTGGTSCRHAQSHKGPRTW